LIGSSVFAGLLLVTNLEKHRQTDSRCGLWLPALWQLVGGQLALSKQPPESGQTKPPFTEIPRALTS